MTDAVAPAEIRPGMPRWLDVVLAGGVLVIVLPALLVVALAVKVSSSGPVLFLQERVGLGGKRFLLFKFRTWRQAGQRPVVTAGNHPLITPVGRFLRKTKLDELPSFWNVVKGDMSLVGPRPEVPGLVSLDDPLWKLTLAARPGITDSVTLVLRNEQDLMTQAQQRFGNMEQFYIQCLQPWKVAGYVRYLRQRTPWTDLKILAQTALSIAGWSPRRPPTMKEILAVADRDTDKRPSGVRWWPGALSRPVQFLIDASVLAASFVVAYLLRFDFRPPPLALHDLTVQLPVVVLVHLVALWLVRAHKVIWRYITLVDQKRFLEAIAGAAAFLLIMRLALPTDVRGLTVPLSVIVINAALGFLGLTGVRATRRYSFERWERGAMAPPAGVVPRKALFVGAGRAGILAMRDLLGRGDAAVDLKGFLDDDPAKTGSLVYDVPVLGTTRDLPRLASRLKIDLVLVTIIGADAQEIQRIVSICESIPVESRVMPNIHDMLQAGPASETLVGAGF